MSSLEARRSGKRLPDIAEVRRTISLYETAKSFGLTLTKNGLEWLGSCPFHDDGTPSFTVYIDRADQTEKFKCFGCGEHGDVIDLVVKMEGLSTREALEYLGGEVQQSSTQAVQRLSAPTRDPYADIVQLDPVQDLMVGQRIALFNPKRDNEGTFTPSAVHPYRRTDGSISGYVLRRDFPDGGKETPMVCWVRLPNGRECWCRLPFEKPRPLYGLDRLGTGQVLIVEGEKSADAAWKLLGSPVVSWPGGTHGVRHTDWSPLAGRDVIVWPDADAPGYEAAKEIGCLLAGVATRVRYIDIMRGARRSDAPATQDNSLSFDQWRAEARPAKGFDCADCVDGKWSRDEVRAMLKEVVGIDLPSFPGADDQDVDQPVPIADARGREHPGAVAAVRADTALEGADILRTVVTEWVFVSASTKFRNVATGEEASVRAFDLRFGRHIPEVDHTVAGRVLKTPKAVVASEWLLGYANGKTVHDLMYLPHLAGDGPVVTLDGVDYLNSYLPRYVPAAAASYVGHCAVGVWQRHLEMILPDDWQLLLTWLAYAVQHPGQKILWAPIVKGTQGDGKTTISKMLGAVMGSRNVKVVSTESLFSDFTGYAEGACVAFLEEIRVKGHNRHDAMNKLKPLVTNEVIEVVRKGQNGLNVPNVTNYMAFTNYADALVIDKSDRRWGVFFTQFDDRDQLTAAGMDGGYFDALHRAIEAHPDVLRAWLLALDTTGFNPKAAPPTTSAKAAMISSSISADAAMLAEMIALGRDGVTQHVAATDCMNVALKADCGQQLTTSRIATAFTELGWRSAGQMWWQDKTRRIYVDGAYDWPLGEAAKRETMRALLDESNRAPTIVPSDLRELDQSW